MKLTSPAFADGAPIPSKHTCDGADLSPVLAWEAAPENTRNFVLICDDPDAPGKTWVHWVLFNLPGTTTRLPEGVPKKEVLENLGGARQGVTDFRRVGYGGPCPPRGNPHRYFFKLYALDGTLDLEAGATKSEVERAMRGRILDQTELMGTYARQ